MLHEVRAVRHHCAHAEREREERVAERLEDASAIQLTEARPEDEPDRLAGPVHPQGGDEKQDEDPEEDRQEDTRDALDALLHAEVDDRDRGHAKHERQSQLQAAIG